MILNFSHVFCSITFLREIAYILEICMARKLEQTTHNKLNEKVLVHDVEHDPYSMSINIFHDCKYKVLLSNIAKQIIKRKLFNFKKGKNIIVSLLRVTSCAERYKFHNFFLFARFTVPSDFTKTIK